VAARFLFACLCIGAWLLLTGQRLKTHNRPLLVLRGVLGGAAVLLFFTAIQLAGAGVGTLLNYTYPIWANVLGVLFLRQRPVAGFWLLLAVALLGVYLVIDPRFGVPSAGELAGLCSAMLAGGAVLCIKKLRDTDDALVIIWSFSLIGLLFALPLVVHGEVTKTSVMPWGDPRAFWLLLGAGLGSFLGHVYFTGGYKHTSLQLGSILALTVPVIAVTSGWLILDEPLAPGFLLGGALILGSCGWLGWLEARPRASRRAG
jgi:drug/metabolite transporter (DMT)-like permease